MIFKTVSSKLLILFTIDTRDLLQDVKYIDKEWKMDLEVKQVFFSYGDVLALDGISFSANRGQICVGQNLIEAKGHV